MQVGLSSGALCVCQSVWEPARVHSMCFRSCSKLSSTQQNRAVQVWLKMTLSCCITGRSGGKNQVWESQPMFDFFKKLLSNCRWNITVIKPGGACSSRLRRLFLFWRHVLNISFHPCLLFHPQPEQFSVLSPSHHTQTGSAFPYKTGEFPALH